MKEDRLRMNFMICNGFNGVNAFTTSLTIIPYYKKEMIVERKLRVTMEVKVSL